MSGHSKWSTIKRKKGALDAKRGAVFTKLGNMITVAAKEKGGDLDTNFTLRLAVDKAKQANMPKDNIERAIKRGTGELEGAEIAEYIYEGIGPASSHFVVRALSDNKNRTAAEVRHAFTKFGGSLSTVMWNFEQKGVIRVSQEKLEENNLNIDDIELELIDAGAEDIQVEEEGLTVFTSFEDLQKVKKYFDEKGIETESAELEYIPKDDIELNDDDLEKVQKFVDILDESDDVTDYYTNVSNL